MREAAKAGVTLSPATLWLIIFLALPMSLAFVYGFATVTPTYQVTLVERTYRWYAEALAWGGEVVQLTLKTFGVATLSTVLAIALGYPVAYYLARLSPEKWRGVLVALMVIPFWISFVVQLMAIFPFTIAGGYFDVFASRLGLMPPCSEGSPFSYFCFGSPGMVVPVLVYIWIPFMILPLFTSLVKIEQETLEAAYDLGASRLRAFLSVTFPLSFPGLITGSILIFISVLGSFIEPLWVAGLPGHLVGNIVYIQFTSAGQLPRGAASAFFLIVATLLLIMIYAYYAEEVGLEVTKEKTLFGRLRRILTRPLRAFWEWLKREVIRKPTEAEASGPEGPTESSPERKSDGPILAQAVPSAPLPRFLGMISRALNTVAERGGKWILGVITILLLLSYYVPMGYVVIFSFNYANNLLVWQGFSTRWWFPEYGGAGEVRALFGDDAVLSALQNSVVVGLVSTGIAVFIGTLAAMAFARYKFRLKQGMNGLLYLGLVVPSIVLGISLLILITFLNDLVFDRIEDFLWYIFGINTQLEWRTGLASIIVAHTTFNIPLATIIMLISFAEFDRTVEEAAMDLGANEVQTFLRVTIPIVKPGLISASLLCFTWSFDDLVVTLFTKGQGVETLPVVIWGLMSKKILSPEIMAVSTLILFIATIFVLLANRVSKGGMIFRI